MSSPVVCTGALPVVAVAAASEVEIWPEAVVGFGAGSASDLVWMIGGGGGDSQPDARIAIARTAVAM